ncbi:DUF6544 family protein [Amnibacterium sp.]|uniref:DUF6544 family protein n=1 Tax=Amnibacterium sp. TaxID=1872496 RepID=UPI002632B7B1|nr:DUF6544 family protein [Amnibacterium sp.]MCU1472710.1 hypothetical protein [Amnibacterium sp.]
MTLNIDHTTTPSPTVPGTTRGRSPGGWVAAGLLAGAVIVHGAIHLLGAAKGLGWAEVTALAQPTSAAMGVAWLVAAAVTIAAGVLLLASVRWWWVVGAAAVLLSQTAIVIDWRDAAFGTGVNVVLGAAVIYAYAAHGPSSFESSYRRRAGHALRRRAEQNSVPLTRPPVPLITEGDLERLPAPVARYISQSGAVGHPQPSSFRALFHGRIRAAGDKPWMNFVGEQVNTFGPMPERFFKMDATRAHLPVDVLHVFSGNEARMRVKLCSLVPMVTASGPDLTRAETVTLLNDLCVLAPAALVGASITWTTMNEHQARAVFTRGDQTVSAELTFDQQDQLTGFTSDDRFAVSANAKTPRRQRWSTPLRRYRSFHGHMISSSGLAVWHAPAPEGDFAYLEFELDDIVYG